MDGRWKGSAPDAQKLVHPRDFLRVASLTFTAPFVLCVRHGSVVGPRGDIITSEGTVFTNVSPEIPRQENHHFLLERGKLPQPRRIRGSVAVLNCGPYRNYFHFLFEAIGRLRLFRQAEITADYYCVAQHLPFQRQLVALFGLDRRRIIPLKKGTHVVAERLFVSSLPGYNTIPAQVHLKDQGTYRFVREAILSRINKNPDPYASHVYVQRTGKRTLVNEAELLEKLRTRGAWKTVRLEDHAVLEQAAIFYHARVIVSLHGAGLANLVFAQAGAQVVEIFHPNLLEPVYFQIATLFGLRYAPIVAESATSLASLKSVRVDPDRVVECLQTE